MLCDPHSESAHTLIAGHLCLVSWFSLRSLCAFAPLR
jgi:hypothetical protein